MVQLLTGRQLKACFKTFCPFENDGSLKPEKERVTILASNLNPPVDVEARAFVMAAAQDEQSPMIIQISYNSMNLAGGKESHFNPPKGVIRQHLPLPATDGAKLEAEVIEEVDAGTHTIFIGKLVNAEILTSEEPMTYAYYHDIKRGVTPKAAPTYIKGEEAIK